MNSRQVYVFFGILTISTLLACQSTPEIKVRRDGLKKAKIVTMTLEHESEETVDLYNNRLPLEILYTKEIKDGQAPTIELKFIVPSGLTKELKQQLFIKADKQKFELKLEGVAKSSATHVYSSTQKDAKGNITGVSSGSETEFVTTANLAVPLDTWRQMMAARKVGYRLYMDQDPRSFIISDKALDQLREFDAQ